MEVGALSSLGQSHRPSGLEWGEDSGLGGESTLGGAEPAGFPRDTRSRNRECPLPGEGPQNPTQGPTVGDPRELQRMEEVVGKPA